MKPLTPITNILCPQGFTPNPSAKYLHQARAFAASTKQVVEISQLTKEQIETLNYMVVLTDQLEQNACMSAVPKKPKRGYWYREALRITK